MTILINGGIHWDERKFNGNCEDECWKIRVVKADWLSGDGCANDFKVGFLLVSLHAPFSNVPDMRSVRFYEIECRFLH